MFTGKRLKGSVTFLRKHVELFEAVKVRKKAAYFIGEK
jgi:hypothetical protein